LTDAAPDRQPTGRRRWLRWVLLLLLLGIGAAGGALAWAWQLYTGPGPLAEARTLVIPRGSGLEATARILADSGVIAEPLIFMAGTRATGLSIRFKAGEYRFEPAMSAQAAAELIVSGRTVVRRLTLREGLTSAEMVALVAGAEGLEGEAGAVPSEGSLLPDTYFYSWGDSRGQILARQRQAMDEALAQLWPRRAPNLPLKSPEEAVVLASIVEMETGQADERPRIAGVFVNRLRIGMRLQADPTVAYGITRGAGPLRRPLSRADLDTRHPWNTYVIEGLPPTPISNPGRAALGAVLNPMVTQELYFVADGADGHLFARTLAEHNRNVARLRQIEADRARRP